MGQKHQRERVKRPWGYYEVIEQGNSYKVKRIVVEANQKLSLQRHKHRAEHWVVVEGIAKVTNGDREYLLRNDQSTYITMGDWHRLENPTDSPLRIIEVQTGTYLEEDDIERDKEYSEEDLKDCES